ncbi:coil containing protein [Vibrio phage 1.253.O._10N.286.45.B12]|nr:coil containing protein [Vibrio phage 1.235.O._10N.261.52.B2]AUR98565.1 coil containing protein [Vibrio phage 1.253.O._10N.286.45.B12]
MGKVIDFLLRKKKKDSRSFVSVQMQSVQKTLAPHLPAMTDELTRLNSEIAKAAIKLDALREQKKNLEVLMNSASGKFIVEPPKNNNGNRKGNNNNNNNQNNNQQKKAA